MKIKTKSLGLFSIAVLFLSTIIGGCKKDNYTEIEGVCPIVISTDPTNLQTGVHVDKVITATFNEAMNPATITSSSFTITGSSQVAGKLTYDEASYTISFVPEFKLDANTTYTGRVTTAMRDLMGSAIQTDYVWSFSTGDTLRPIVVMTDPINNADEVALDKNIMATFSMPMDPSSIHSTSFSVRNGSVKIPGTISYTGTTATFTPTNLLEANTVYTGYITTEAANVRGIKMANDYIWHFRTVDTTSPIVIATDPADLSTGVPLSKVIKATFNKPMDASTLNNTTFTLKQGALPITGVVSANGINATFTPSSPLQPNKVYTATITTGAKSNKGIAMANQYTWTFTTVNNPSPQVISTDPSNNATGVALNKVVKATFDMQMDATTFSTSTFTLKQGGNTVAGIVTYTGTTASYTPTSNLSNNTTYTATITTGAQSSTGVPLGSNYTWSFQTLAALPPATPVIDLKSAGRFGILSGTGISNNAGFSVINNLDVGISPGVRSSVTGFPPATIVNGAIYASDDILPAGTAAMLIQAKQDLTDAYLFAEAMTLPAPVTVSGDLGGLTLAPGIYKSTSTLAIVNGNLTLDAGGDPNAFWVFQISSAFTSVGGAGGSVILAGGAQAKNVFWQSGSSATIGDGTSFKGNVLVLTSITMNSGAVAEGRMLARNGAVVLTNTNIISKP